MTVEVALGRQHTYHFNESRLERVLTANTLDEAGKMGLLDKILDWFRGGVKLEAIQAVYQQVTQPGVLTPSQVAQRFCALRNLTSYLSVLRFSSLIRSSISLSEF